MAAESYAKITDGLGVCLVTAGPGGTNAVTGVAGAWLDSTPMLVLSGQAKRADLKGRTGVRQMGVQEVDIVAIVSPITKYAVTVMEPADIRFHLEKAVYLARTGGQAPCGSTCRSTCRARRSTRRRCAASTRRDARSPGGTAAEIAAAVAERSSCSIRRNGPSC